MSEAEAAAAAANKDRKDAAKPKPASGSSGGASAGKAASGPDTPRYLKNVDLLDQSLLPLFNVQNSGSGKIIPDNTKFATAQGLSVVNAQVAYNLYHTRKNAVQHINNNPAVFPEGVMTDYNIESNELLFISHQRQKNTSDAQHPNITPAGQGLPHGVYSCFNMMPANEHPVCIGFATTNHVSHGPDAHGDKVIAMGVEGVLTGYNAGQDPIHAGDALWWDFPSLLPTSSAAHKNAADRTANDFVMRAYSKSAGPTKIVPVLRPYRPGQHGVSNIMYTIKTFLKAQEDGDSKTATEYTNGVRKFSPCQKVHDDLVELLINKSAGGWGNANGALLLAQYVADHHAFIKSRIIGQALKSCPAHSNGLTVLFGLARIV